MTSVPEWLAPLAAAVERLDPEEFRGMLPPEGVGRPSAVLVLFGEGPEGPDLLFIQRASDMRAHAGQPAFPGGAVDSTDRDPAHTALRESEEEVGVASDGVHVFAQLPGLWLRPSGFVVTPVLAWWHDPVEVHAVDPNEVAAVERVPISELVDPANRCQVGTLGGMVGPGFKVRDLLIWGFTAGLVDRLLTLGGWAVPWGPGPVYDRPVPSNVEGVAN